MSWIINNFLLFFQNLIYENIHVFLKPSLLMNSNLGFLNKNTTLHLLYIIIIKKYIYLYFVDENNICLWYARICFASHYIYFCNINQFWIYENKRKNNNNFLNKHCFTDAVHFFYIEFILYNNMFLQFVLIKTNTPHFVKYQLHYCINKNK